MFIPTFTNIYHTNQLNVRFRECKTFNFLLQKGSKGSGAGSPSVGPDRPSPSGPLKGDLRGRFSKCGEIHTTLQRGRFFCF